MTVKLQVALDLMNLERAIRIAREAVKGGADWLEAGTPLIKAEGMEAVRRLKKEFPDKIIVADMKTMDVGGVEVEMAAKAGADIIGVLGAADDETIKEGVKAAHNYDAEVITDMLRVEEPAKRTREVCKLGAKYVGVHVGVDSQMRGEDPLNMLENVVKASTVPVSVAGGITSNTVSQLVEKGAEIIVVGGAIIKAKDVTKATADLKKAIEEGVNIESEVSRKYTTDEIKDAFEKVSTANISDAMHRAPCMQGIKQLTAKGMKVVGPAFTVRTVDGDWAKPVEAIEKASEEEVIVVDAGGGTTAVWGELASHSCKMKGVLGIVIDGAVRDVDGIDEIGFPVFARHKASNAGDPKGYGGLGSKIKCGNVEVSPGDWIIGDTNGVMVVPKEEALMIANRSMDVMEKENRIREEIKEGRTLSVVMELEKWEKVE